eukprot:7199476-Prymnesium_polylepis.1
MSDIAEAVRRTCAQFEDTLPSEVLQDSNAFRARFCYIERTDMVLRRHLNTITLLFKHFSASSPDVSSMASSRLMSIDEFFRFVSGLGLIEDGQLTDQEVKLIFLWSRIRSVQGFSNRSQIRLRHLMLEDFMEAIVRISIAIALPTDAELELVQGMEAGEFIMTLRHGKDEYAKFITAHDETTGGG